VQVAVPAAAGVPFPGRLVVARADPGPRRQVGGVGEELAGLAPIPEMTAAAASAPVPGMVVSSSRSARKGAIIASTWASSFAIISSRRPV
jgi:hypothetical protein